MWAFTIFSSRSFTSDVLNDTLPAEKASRLGRADPDHLLLARFFDDSFPVLLPLLDLLNYRPGARVEWQSGLQDVGLRVLDRLDAGQEVCNNYGPKANESLLLGYGFTIPNNPFDYYAVGFKVPEGSPLAEARRLLNSARPRDEQTYRYHIVNAQHPQAVASDWLELSLFSLDLFDSISVLSGNSRELEDLGASGKRLSFDSRPEKFGRPRRQRNILQTLFQLHVDCTSRVKPLETVRDAPTTPKQVNIDIYRTGQLMILRTAALLCRYCLLKAASTDAKPVLRDAAAAEGLDETSEPVANLQRLLEKEAATTCQTLFTASAIIDYLPKPLTITLHHATEAAALAAPHYPSPTLSPADILEKIKFTLILSALRAVHTSKSIRLPRRFRAWMRDLQSWYGFDDEYCNAPAEEFAPILPVLIKAGEGVAMDTSVEGMWDERCLAWGWNVQQEEGLFAETEAVAVAEGTGLRPVKYRLCIPLKRKAVKVEEGVDGVGEKVGQSNGTAHSQPEALGTDGE